MVSGMLIESDVTLGVTASGPGSNVTSLNVMPSGCEACSGDVT